MPAGGFDTAMLLTARRRAHSVALPLIAPAVVATARTAPTVPTAELAPSTATTGHMLPHAEGGAPFSPGQSEQARVSVRMAIEKQRPPPGQNELWGSNQADQNQANKESNNVRLLLQADGMPNWRADTRKLPPRRPANASMEQLLEHVPIGSSAWLITQIVDPARPSFRSVPALKGVPISAVEALRHIPLSRLHTA